MPKRRFGETVAKTGEAVNYGIAAALGAVALAIPGPNQFIAGAAIYNGAQGFIWGKLADKASKK